MSSMLLSLNCAGLPDSLLLRCRSASLPARRILSVEARVVKAWGSRVNLNRALRLEGKSTRWLEAMVEGVGVGHGQTWAHAKHLGNLAVPRASAE